MNNTYRPALLLLPACLAASTLDGAATRISFVDSFATSRGNAFTATADTPSAVFYNAAGLIQMEDTEVRANAFSISLGYTFDGASGDDEMDEGFQTVPSFFVGHRFADAPFAVGFGAYAPFALASDWGSDAGLALDPSVPYAADLAYVKYHAAMAWRVTDTLTLAAGISFDDTEIDVEANALQFNGEDRAAGYTLSLLWKPSPTHAFGLNYQARTEVTYAGTANVFVPQLNGFVGMDATADLVFPESITVGYAYRPNDKWNFEINLDWTNWDRVNTLSLDGVPGAAYALNWESAFIWEAGVTRYFENGWRASAGYTFVENAVPDADFLPIIPDSDRHFFALGVGRSYDQISWDLTYQFTHADSRRVTGNTFGTVNGEYDLESQALAFSLSYRF